MPSSVKASHQPQMKLPPKCEMWLFFCSCIRRATITIFIHWNNICNFFFFQILLWFYFHAQEWLLTGILLGFLKDWFYLLCFVSPYSNERTIQNQVEFNWVPEVIQEEQWNRGLNNEAPQQPRGMNKVWDSCPQTLLFAQSRCQYES